MHATSVSPTVYQIKIDCDRGKIERNVYTSYDHPSVFESSLNEKEKNKSVYRDKGILIHFIDPKKNIDKVPTSSNLYTAFQSMIFEL